MEEAVVEESSNQVDFYHIYTSSTFCECSVQKEEHCERFLIPCYKCLNVNRLPTLEANSRPESPRQMLSLDRMIYVQVMPHQEN